MSGGIMRITRIINNNVICAVNERNQERILIGKGIGFHKKAGDEVDKRQIDKEYFLKSRTIAGKLYALLAQTPAEYMEICENIIKKAQEVLRKELNENIYLTLLDHISFAITRSEKGLQFKNALTWEVKRFYSTEFSIAMYGLDLIRERLHVSLPEDEAASIALHIVNAQMDANMEDTIRVTQLIQKILNIVRYQFCINFNEESFHYGRFVTHLKFFAFRMFSHALLEETDSEFQEIVKNKYPEEYRCGERIADLIWNDYQVRLPQEELIYLAIHIRRVIHCD